jgi:hypothetical protein
LTLQLSRGFLPEQDASFKAVFFVNVLEAGQVKDLVGVAIHPDSVDELGV